MSPHQCHTPLAPEGYPVGYNFHPLGMEVYPSSNGSSSNLFIINYACIHTLFCAPKCDCVDEPDELLSSTDANPPPMMTVVSQT
ncbi:hypothetical protein OG21DRAFT_1489329 [Imleria badia]|nr:hypothetical protein OG21DRAFT_1489329 [Imleria badia]